MMEKSVDDDAAVDADLLGSAAGFISCTEGGMMWSAATVTGGEWDAERSSSTDDDADAGELSNFLDVDPVADSSTDSQTPDCIVNELHTFPLSYARRLNYIHVMILCQIYFLSSRTRIIRNCNYSEHYRNGADRSTNDDFALALCLYLESQARSRCVVTCRRQWRAIAVHQHSASQLHWLLVASRPLHCRRRLIGA